MVTALQFKTNLPHDIRKEAEGLIKRHKKLEAMIESKKMDLPIKMTSSSPEIKVQGSNQFHSETERIVELREYIGHLEETKQKLDYIYNSLSPIQKEIWTQRYLLGRFDSRIYEDLDITDKKYYNEKKEVVALVAEAFDLCRNFGIKKQ